MRELGERKGEGIGREGERTGREGEGTGSEGRGEGGNWEKMGVGTGRKEG